MKRPKLKAENILKALESQMAEILEFSGASFETLEDYYSLGDARLSVFRSDGLWVIVIEAIRYHARDDLAFVNDIWLYGNALAPLEERFEDASRRIVATPRCWQTRIDDAGVWEHRRKRFSILWRGKRYNFSPAREEFEAAGIAFSQREWKSGVLTPTQVMRYVCHAMDHPFFASEDVLRDLIDARFMEGSYEGDNSGAVYKSWYHTEAGDFDERPDNCHLELFLQTRDWRHPRSESDQPAISIREAFEPLAHAIATGDLSYWHKQDAAGFNSHWSNWVQTEADFEVLQAQHSDQLAEEGKRFRAWLAKVPEEERAAFIEELKRQWEEDLAEAQRIQQVAGAFGAPMIYLSGSVLQFDDETFTFGPHLWREDTSDQASVA